MLYFFSFNQVSGMSATLNPFNCLPTELAAIIAVYSGNPALGKSCKKMRDTFCHPVFFKTLEAQLPTKSTIMGLSDVGTQVLRQNFQKQNPGTPMDEAIRNLFREQQRETCELKKQHACSLVPTPSPSFLTYLATDKWIDSCNDAAIRNAKSRKGLLKRTFRPDGIVLTRITSAITAFPKLTKLILIDNHVRALSDSCSDLKNLEAIVISNQDLVSLPISLTALRKLKCIKVDRTPTLSVPIELTPKAIVSDPK